MSLSVSGSVRRTKQAGVLRSSQTEESQGHGQVKLEGRLDFSWLGSPASTKAVIWSCQVNRKRYLPLLYVLLLCISWVGGHPICSVQKHSCFFDHTCRKHKLLRLKVQPRPRFKGAWIVVGTLTIRQTNLGRVWRWVRATAGLPSTTWGPFKVDS